MGRYRVKVNPHIDTSLIPEGWPDVWQFLATNPGNLVLEIGSGMGEFLVNQAENNPDCHFLGLEMQYIRVLKGTEYIWKNKLKNIRFFHIRADEDLAQQVDIFRFRQLHINHPDPWKKKRHQKRKIIRPSMLDQFHAILSPQGKLYISSDDPTLIAQTRHLLRDSPLFELEGNDYLPENHPEWSQRASSRFADKLAAKGFPSRLFVATKLG